LACHKINRPLQLRLSDIPLTHGIVEWAAFVTTDYEWYEMRTMQLVS